MREKALEHRARLILEDGEFLAEWLTRFEAEGLKNAWARAWKRYEQRPKPRDYFKKLGMRIRGNIKAADSNKLDSEDRDFLVGAFLEETFVFLLCIFCINVEAGRQKIREEFGHLLPDLGNAEVWKDFLGVLREYLPDADRWIESDEIRIHLGDRGFDFDAAFRAGKDGRVLLEFVPMNEQSKVIVALANLVGSGNIGRLRLCRQCKRFFFAGQRKHKKFCSHHCQTAHWQGTPEGRAYKRAQMKDVRAKWKVLQEAKRQGRKLKRGRRLHVTLKKGE